jgi:hypothetical protein
MKKSANVTLTLVAAMGIAARAQQRPEPCEAATFNEQVAQAFQRLNDIAMPQQVLDALHLLRYRPAARFLFRLRRPGLLLQNRQPHRDVKPVDDVFAFLSNTLPSRTKT